MEAINAEVSGRVQGVGYRYSTQEIGRRLGLTGWVRNNRDGTVSVFAQGQPEPVAQFLRYLEEGPRMARVESVAAIPAEPDPALQAFEVRF